VKLRRWSGRCAVLLLALVAGRAEGAAAQAGEEGDTLTLSEVRRFLDPTVMVNRFEYRFQANYIPGDVQIYSHRARPWIALNSWSAAWVRVPWIDVSLPDGSGHSGIGDVSVGGGVVIHENLGSRLTASAASFDLLMPTGDRAKGTGFDRLILQSMGALVFNPTDLFPVYLLARYHHSVADGSEPEDGRVRTLSLSVQTFHILPRRFFLLFIPSFYVDVQRDQTAFTFGIGGGRAMTRRLAVQASYVQHIVGWETFSRGFQLGFNYFWGPNRGR